jgi:hypothetical protein
MSGVKSCYPIRPISGGAVLLDASTSAAGSCFGDLGFNPATAASGQSVLSGVLAGFVFGGIVVVLSTREGRRGEHAACALKLLFSAFVGLAVVAYLFADTAASASCLQTSAQETLSGGILGAFAIVMIVALTWLLVAYSLHAGGVLKFLRRLIWFASAFVVLLLCTSSYDYLVAALPSGPPQWVFILIYVAGAVSLLAAVRPYSWTRGFALVVSRLVRQNESVSPVPEPVTGRERAVSLCTTAAIGYLSVAAISDALALSVSDWWNHSRPGISYIVAWASLLLPLAVLVTALRALAPDANSGMADEKERPNAQQAAALEFNQQSVGHNEPAAAAGADQNLLQTPRKQASPPR